jgi:hypothetical protein
MVAKMAEHCFIKNGSDPPVCGVHNVALVRDEVPIDKHAPYLGRVACLICPVSGLVPKDEAPKGSIGASTLTDTKKIAESDSRRSDRSRWRSTPVSLTG